MDSPIASMYKVPDDLFFNVSQNGFVAEALRLYQWQRQHNPVLQHWLQNTGACETPESLLEIRCLPISFFKTHLVTSRPQDVPSLIFTSSGTTGSTTSRHAVYEPEWYRQICRRGWSYFFGDPSETQFHCLLPAYMERQGSSLIYMMEDLVDLNRQGSGGFYLNAQDELSNALANARLGQINTVLFGVTFALLDFAERHPINLSGIRIMDTGGMKGRRQELTRQQVHETLSNAFGVNGIASEYGMTELMSQAYALSDGRLTCPPWMKVLVRDESDPFALSLEGSGLLCIIDLANKDSCAFIETQDVGRVFSDGSFEVLGRLDHADLRGCNLLVA